MNEPESYRGVKKEELPDRGQILFSMLHAAGVLQDRLERAMETVGLSMAKFSALSQLARAGEPLPLGELAERLSCVRSNMTQLMDRLVADGLVQRTNDPNDRRIIRAELTPLGRERAVAGATALEGVQGEFGHSLTDEDRECLGRLFSSIR